MLSQAEQVSLSVWSGIEDEKGLYISKNARPGNADIVTRSRSRSRMNGSR